MEDLVRSANQVYGSAARVKENARPLERIEGEQLVMATALKRPPVNISQENKAAVLRLLASAHQITQEQIAEAIGVSQSGVSAYMSGQREIPNRRLEALGALFELPPEAFVWDAAWVEAQYQPALDDVSRFRDKRLEKARSLLLVMSNRTRQKVTKDALTGDTPRSENHPAARSNRAAINPAA